MNIKVGALPVSEKSINTSKLHVSPLQGMCDGLVVKMNKGLVVKMNKGKAVCPSMFS